MSELEDAIVQSRDDVLFAALNFDDQNYYDKWEKEFDAALARLERLVRLDARRTALRDVTCIRTDDAHMPDECVIDVDDLKAMQRDTEAEIAEAVK